MSHPLPTWAPRLKAFRLRRLYESDAQGRLDLELLDEVGWALYSRCASFIQANEARQGRVLCPVCHALILHQLRAKETLTCPQCGWTCSLRAYLDTIKDQQLDGGPEVIALFQHYVDHFPKAKEPTEKMLLIDGLIHGFHHYLRSGRTRRPVGVNLIDGPLEFVIDFLDHLTYGPNSTPGVQQTYGQWREKVYSRSKKKASEPGGNSPG